MQIHTQFNQLRQQWIQHCTTVSFSSHTDDYTNCQAFRDIVNMENDIIPFIIECMVKQKHKSQDADNLWWFFVLEKLNLNDNRADLKKGFNAVKENDFWLCWW